jgi:predicted nucleic acid-binding protein
LIENLQRHAFRENEKLLLDTNIWLFAFGDAAFKYKNENSSIYLSLLSKMANSKIYICRPIISEFVNKCIDVHWKRWKIEKNPRNNDRKAFRNDPNFERTAKEIAQDTEEILNMVKCYCDSTFDDAKARDFLNEFVGHELDFNDIILKYICKSNGLTLVTDDGDFKNYNDITILTANSKSLR